LLESAVATPAQQFSGEYLHAGIPAMAAAYAFHISQNHPFVDGNKRAAAGAMIAFLSNNGWVFDAIADEAEPVLLRLAAGEIDKAEFTEWLRSHVHEKPRMDLREFFERFDYRLVIEFLESGLFHDRPDLAHRERVDTINEAVLAIPAIKEALLIALHCEREGDPEGAARFRAQARLLTAIYRIAQDMGYEW
jgi:death-on-curing protein